MKQTKHQSLFLLFTFLFTLLFTLSHATAGHEDPNSLTSSSSIVFATLGRSSYAFDIFSLPTWDPPTNANELQHTDGYSVNYNGHFPSTTPLSLFPPSPNHTLVYVTERNGSSNIYLDAVYYHDPDHCRKRSILENYAESNRIRVESSTDSTRIQVPLVGSEESGERVSMKDRPSLLGEYLVYVSTHENSGVARTSWTAVYSTHLKTGLTRRLTPKRLSDFSPAVSPSGIWTAVASYGEQGWAGEVEELGTDIYVFLTRDGSARVKVVEHGGWPSWADELTLYFHRMCEDGWFSVFKAILPENGLFNVDSVVTQRITPPGIHAFTPAASVSNKSFIVVATRRPNSDYRHVELFDVVTKEFREVTRSISPNANHFNPFISPDSTRIGYHTCRGTRNGQGNNNLILENLQNPVPEISLFRIDGSFPSFSPNGDRIAYVKFPGVYVMNRDGSGLREIFNRTAFSTAWDPKREGVVYTSTGPTFASESTKVDIISINIDDEKLSYKTLTVGGENNAFPSASPDGKWVVFRSGRSGHKNLYIMDALDGETGWLDRLTEGQWTDTMCNWSPDGDWIAFASDRDNPGSGSFALYMVHPNGTGLKKLVHSGSGGRCNHPWFSPDGKYIVFTSDYAGVSAEPISNPHHYQPYGDIFMIRSDSSGIKRLTHNSYEDGTPAWGPTFMKPVDVEWPNGGPQCTFEDCYWLNIRSSHCPDEVAASASTQLQCGQ